MYITFTYFPSGHSPIQSHDSQRVLLTQTLYARDPFKKRRCCFSWFLLSFVVDVLFILVLNPFAFLLLKKVSIVVLESYVASYIHSYN